jgi:hypothetical protein
MSYRHVLRQVLVARSSDCCICSGRGSIASDLSGSGRVRWLEAGASILAKQRLLFRTPDSAQFYGCGGSFSAIPIRNIFVIAFLREEATSNAKLPAQIPSGACAGGETG